VHCSPSVLITLETVQKNQSINLLASDHLNIKGKKKKKKKEAYKK